jgi:diguanylate cyclase (GGDEF)-like protein
MTTPPDLTPDEPARLQALRELNLVDTPLEERFERITRLARGLLDVDIVAVSLVESDRQFFKSIQGLDVCGTSRDVSFCGHTILGDDLHIVPDARLDDRFNDNPLVTGPPNIVTYAAMPLRSQDGFNIGSLCAIHSSPRDFDADELQHLRDLAAMAELELQVAAANAVQAALVEEVSTEQRRAMIDSLTRMWNRDGIYKLAEEAMANLGTAEDGMAMVMIDLDQFKPINDTFGHAAGDEVLRSAARRMLAAVRDCDGVGRVGGDEFLCVLTRCDSASSAAMVAERIRARLSAHPIKTDAGDIDLTASLGVGFAAPGSVATLDELIETADAALYKSKRGGRNAVSLDGTDRKAA